MPTLRTAVKFGILEDFIISSGAQAEGYHRSKQLNKIGLACQELFGFTYSLGIDFASHLLT